MAKGDLKNSGLNDHLKLLLHSGVETHTAFMYILHPVFLVLKGVQKPVGSSSLTRVAPILSGREGLLDEGSHAL